MNDPRALSARILAGALMAALVLILFALSFVLVGLSELPPLWAPLAQVTAGVIVHFVLEQIGYRVPALQPGQEDPGTSYARFQSAMILRFALSEAIAIASLAGAFVVTEGGFLVYVGGMLVSLALMAIHVWPGRRPVERTAAALESGGVRSPLRETFGFGGQGGAVQRL